MDLKSSKISGIDESPSQNPALTNRISSLHPILVVLYLLGIYTYISIPIGPNLALPAALAGFAGIVLLILNLPSVRGRHVRPLLLFVIAAFMSIVFAPSPLTYFSVRARGLMLLIYSMAVTYGLYLELARWPKKTLSRLFLAMCLLIILGCILENYLGLRSISDAFRTRFFPSGLYVGDNRDLTYVGMIRPKLFTSEPSHLAKAFLVFSVTWLILTNHKKKYIIFFSFALSSIFLIRSPITILTLPAGMAVKCFSTQRFFFSPRNRHTLRTLISFLAIVVLLTSAFAFVFEDRINSLISGGDYSTLFRIVAPLFTMTKTLSESPLFGAGISGTESITQYTFSSLQNLGIPLSFVQSRPNLAHSFYNAFFLHWIYYGILGGLLCLYFLWKYMKNIGVRHCFLSFVIIFIYSQTMGAINSVRFWTFLTVTVLAAMQLEKETLRRNAIFYRIIPQKE